MALAIGNELCHYPIKWNEADMPTRQDKHTRVLRDKAIVDGIGRGLADMKAGNTVPHDAAMAEVDTLLDGIAAATFFAERAKRADLHGSTAS